ncbi:hypothetical protein [Saccharopolyspora hattusasensis]|uniref:hypothetical protein n=1 Tax=Saccharopolyspora hattusasensis TaxID=1128679 RepID=UPI003D975D0F
MNRMRVLTLAADRPEYSKQLNVAAYNALQAAASKTPDFGDIILYPQDINLPGTGLGAFQLNGSGVVLFGARPAPDPRRASIAGC